MQLHKIQLTAILFVSLAQCTVSAQEAVDASGGNASGSGGSASYSIGQTAYTTHISTNGSVAQGVQQPYEISTITALEEAKNINLTFLVYPNPTTNFLKLKVENYSIDNLTYLLYDLTGKSIQNKKIESLETIISMESIATGIYFLKITENNKDLKTFKIIKN